MVSNGFITFPVCRIQRLKFDMGETLHSFKALHCQHSCFRWLDILSSVCVCVCVWLSNISVTAWITLFHLYQEVESSYVYLLKYCTEVQIWGN